MTFLVNKGRVHFTFSGRYSRSEAGVTLLLSVLLLAGITTIAFSLAAVGFAEITTSSDLAKTEPIFYHGLGVAEEATYGLKRGVNNIKTALGTECAASLIAYTGLNDGSGINVKTKRCNINPDKSVEVIVPPNTFSTAVRLYAYDPAKLYDDADVGNDLESGYTSIILKKTSNNGGIVKLYVCPLSSTECQDPTPPSNQIAGWAPPAGVALDYNTQVNISNPGVASEIVLINSGGSREFVEVATEPRGLPYLNKEAVEVQSAFGRLIRRLRVLVPIR